MRSTSWLAAILSLLLAACGGGGGSSSNGNAVVGTGQTPLDAPVQLVVTETGPNEITLTWGRPAGSFTGYNLEVRIGSGAYQQVNTDLLPSNYVGLILTFAETAPDATAFTFRLRAVRGTLLSDYSNEATYFRPPNSPTQPRASYDPATNAVALVWTRNSTGSDGLMVERAECTRYGSVAGPWLALPISDPQATSYLDNSGSTGSYYAYRVTNLKGGLSGSPSALSNLSYFGLTPLSGITGTFDTTQGGITVSWWTSSSSTADGVLLERSDCDAQGTPQGNWSALPLPAGSRLSYTDSTVLDGRSYSYRASNLYGTRASLPCQLAKSIAVPMFAPANLLVTATTGGLKLTWQNHSSVAAQILIRRDPATGTSSDIAILTPDANTYLDPVPSLGYYTYTVVAKNSAGEASSPSVTAGTLNPAGALALTATNLNFPASADAALRPGGSWSLATTSPFGVLSNGDPWPASFPTNAGVTTDPIIQVDHQGWPHAVYATSISSSGAPATIMHMWFDGTAWQSESIASATLPTLFQAKGFSYRLDSTGTPHLLLDHVTAQNPYGGSTGSLSYHHKSNGAWVEEPLSVISPAIGFYIGSYHLRLDASDTPHLLISAQWALNDFLRTAPGSWAATNLPTSPFTPNGGSVDGVDSLWLDGTHGWVFFESNLASEVGLYALQMKDGAWLPPQLLGVRASDSLTLRFRTRCALSPDGSRIAILYATSTGFKVYHQLPDGWHETLLAPTPTWVSTMSLGFDESQKAHILISLGSGCTDYHE